MRRIWKKFALRFMAWVDTGLCRADEQYGIVLSGPEKIITVWEFFIFWCLLFWVFISLPEIIFTGWFLSKIKKREIKPLFIKVMDFLVKKISKEKSTVYKEKLTEKERFIYYKAALSAFLLLNRNPDEYVLNKLTQLLSEAHENYLILRLSGVE